MKWPALCMGVLAVSLVHAGVPGEVPAMDSLESGAGTRLVAMPTYVYERSPGQEPFAQDELWSPELSVARHLPNRYSRILQWQVPAPGVWFSTGNEIGDLLYQELLDTSSTERNRTPMLDGGMVWRSTNGFWVTGQGSQVDHYADATLAARTRIHGDMSFAWFGENLPAYSTAYAGGGWQDEAAGVSLLGGKEYLWAQTRSRRWVPVEVSPRVQANAYYGRTRVQVVYEKQEFASALLGQVASKQIYDATIRSACPRECAVSPLSIGGGLSIRHESDSAQVPWNLGEQSTRAWPWLEAYWKPVRWFRWGGHAGMNDQDRLVRDSLELHGVHGASRIRVGWLHQAGTRTDPMGYNQEVYQGDTLDLHPSGYMLFQKGYTDIQYVRAQWNLSAGAYGWMARGVETFAYEASQDENGLLVRSGQVERIGAWLGGAGLQGGLHYEDSKKWRGGGEGGFERYAGPVSRLEVTPVTAWAKWQLGGRLAEGLWVDHEWVYRSSARWNQDSSATMVVPGGLWWSASIAQNFPQLRTTLQATLQHALGPERREAPNGGYDRKRIYCSLRTNF